jgi:uncharacterized damage-inducible protein DinB
MNLVEQAVRNWEAFRAGVIAEVENTPEDKLDYRPAAGARTLRELAVHIAEASVLFTNELLRPDGSFMNLFKPDVQAELRATLPPAHSKAEIVSLLRLTGEQTAARLRTAGEALIAETMASQRGPQSRLSALWFAASHESYHRGQLASYARGCGAVPALTKQLEAMLRG